MNQIAIKNYTSNHIFYVNYNVTDNVTGLKQMICNKTGINVKNQRLIYCGCLLEDHKNLSDLELPKINHLVLLEIN